MPADPKRDGPKSRDTKLSALKGADQAGIADQKAAAGDPIPRWAIWMGGSLLFLVLVLSSAAPDWCLMPLIGGAFFAYYRFRETPVLILVLIIFALILARIGLTPESILKGSEFTGLPGSIPNENWLIATLLVTGVLGCAYACQSSNELPGPIVRQDMQSWLTQLVWILAPVLFLSILAYQWILGQPDQFLRNHLYTELDIGRARLLGLAFFGGGGILAYTLIRAMAHGNSLASTEALGSLYETIWRQTRREQSRIQQWLVAARRRKG